MSHAITPDYNQIFMFPPTVEEWVPANHPARFLREVVDSLDLEQMGFSINRGIDGRPHYDEGLLLKIWLYGLYCNRIRSVRGLEKTCMENLADADYDCPVQIANATDADTKSCCHWPPKKGMNFIQ